MTRVTQFDYLAQGIQRHTRRAGDHATAFAPLSLHQRDKSTEPVACIYGLGLAVTAQGGKRVMMGDRFAEYGPGGSMLTTVDMAVTSRVIRATTREPYLGLLLLLDAHIVTQLASEMDIPSLESHDANGHVSIEDLDFASADALCRLVDLLDEPELVPYVGPLLQQEIAVRILASPRGPLLRRLSALTPPREQIARILAWLKQDFAQTISVDELADRACMSPSTFRKHFRAVTGTSPLQYQKQLRLLEARQLMLDRGVDASSAALQVGYESVSQFSREYRRQFGTPPQQDIRQIRATAQLRKNGQ